MKILVTGATGYLGKHILSELQSRGLNYRALSRSPQSEENFVQCDILDAAQLDVVFDDIDVLIHSAGLVSHEPEDAEKVQEIHVKGTELILQAASRARPEKLRHSTCSSSPPSSPSRKYRCTCSPRAARVASMLVRSPNQPRLSAIKCCLSQQSHRTTTMPLSYEPLLMSFVVVRSSGASGRSCVHVNRSTIFGPALRTPGMSSSSTCARVSLSLTASATRESAARRHSHEPRRDGACDSPAAKSRTGGRQPYQEL